MSIPSVKTLLAFAVTVLNLAVCVMTHTICAFFQQHVLVTHFQLLPTVMPYGMIAYIIISVCQASPPSPRALLLRLCKLQTHSTPGLSGQQIVDSSQF